MRNRDRRDLNPVPEAPSLNDDASPLAIQGVVAEKATSDRVVGPSRVVLAEIEVVAVAT